MKTGSAAIFITCALLSALAVPAFAAEESESQRRAAAVSPFIDDQTLLVIGLSLSEARIAEGIEMLGALKPGVVEVSEIRLALTFLTQVGVREAYLVGSLSYLPEHSPLLVVPVAGEPKADKIVEALKEQYEAAVVCNGRVIAGDARTVACAEQAEPVVRPEIGDAFEAAEGAAVQMLLLPTSDQRDVIESMIPRLPRDIGGQSIKIVTRGCRWAALGVKTRPTNSLQLVVQSADATSAEAFRRFWEELVEMACRHPDVADTMPPIAEPPRVLTPFRQNDRLLLELHAEKKEITALSALLRAPAAMARESAKRSESRQKLLTLGLALQTYADKHSTFPPSAICSSWGIPLLSWRVHLLRLLGEDELYARFHLNEPWNSKHNKELIDLMPAVFRRPGEHADRDGRTPYVTPRGRGTALNTREETPYEAFRDTTTNTILLVETDSAHEVVWTQPVDLDYDADEPWRGLHRSDAPGFLALFADGRVRLIRHDTDAELLRALFTRSGGEKVELDEP